MGRKHHHYGEGFRAEAALGVESGLTGMNIVGRIAKNLATSFAMENVVSQA
jgi:hypothetical protein